MFVRLAIIAIAAICCSAGDSNPVPLNALEVKFQNTLTNCVLNGRWCTTKKGEMAEEYHDQYTILGATKSGKDSWEIRARVQFAGRNLTVPVPVKLRWAGDTPVIVLDSVSVPGVGTYSARVLIHGNTYAGSWSTKDEGGMLHGTIHREGPVAKAARESEKQRTN